MMSEEEAEKPAVIFSSAIKSPEQERAEARQRILQREMEDKGIEQKDSINYGPKTMAGFSTKASSDFDGGDGQVGVVGDGSTAMEEFDKSEVIKAKIQDSTLVKESKARQRNAWGNTNSGVAEALKKEGMVDIDFFGEDRLKVRRQQLENYHNQQMLKKAQDAAIDALESAEGKKQGRNNKDYMSDLGFGAKTEAEEDKWNVYKPEASSTEAKDFGEVIATGKVRKEYSIVASPGKSGQVKVEQRNIVMTFQPFRAAFPAGTSSAWTVKPESGSLERRGGPPAELIVTYRPEVVGPPEEAMLVVDTEEFKHVYKITGSSG